MGASGSKGVAGKDHLKHSSSSSMSSQKSSHHHPHQDGKKSSAFGFKSPRLGRFKGKAPCAPKAVPESFPRSVPEFSSEPVPISKFSEDNLDLPPSLPPPPPPISPNEDTFKVFVDLNKVPVKLEPYLLGQKLVRSTSFKGSKEAEEDDGKREDNGQEAGGVRSSGILKYSFKTSTPLSSPVTPEHLDLQTLFAERLSSVSGSGGNPVNVIRELVQRRTSSPAKIYGAGSNSGPGSLVFVSGVKSFGWEAF